MSIVKRLQHALKNLEITVSTRDQARAAAEIEAGGDQHLKQDHEVYICQYRRSHLTWVICIPTV